LITANYWLIALTGQMSTHAPHSTHVSSSTTALPSLTLIADVEHSLTQASQPTHVSWSTTTFAIGKPSYSFFE
jgi:hypothetical protein